MNARVPANPYSPPGAAAAGARVDASAGALKAAGSALLVGVPFAAVVGAISAVQMAAALVRFGGIEYVPRVLVLDALRASGPASAPG